MLSQFVLQNYHFLELIFRFIILSEKYAHGYDPKDRENYDQLMKAIDDIK